MTRITRAAFGVAVVVMLASPDLANAQAKGRSGGSSRSGPSGGRSAGRAPSARSAPARKAPPPRPAPAKARAVRSSGSSTTTRSSTLMARPSGASPSASAPAPGIVGAAAGRDRIGGPSVGQAVRRPNDGPFGSIFLRTRHQLFRTGFGAGLGFGSRFGLGLGYNFLGFGRNSFGLGGRYGYNPWGFGGYGSGYGYRSYGTYTSGQSPAGGGTRGETGSIRLRASPRDAQVYVDGALAGTVDDFDGLGGHLQLAAGHHQLELRAPGYQPYVADLAVVGGRTKTERATLKKINR